MNLGELKRQIAFGELSNLVWAKDGELVDKYDAYVTEFVYEALNILYDKYNIKQEAVYLEPIEGKQDYEISNEHLMSGQDLDPTYDQYLWLPNQTKFDSDILKITGVIDFMGRGLLLNDRYAKNSLFTPKYNVLQIPALLVNAGHEFEIQLAMAHPSFENGDESTIEIPVPYIPAVRAYVAYLVHSNLNTENAVQNATKYLQQYQMILNEVIPDGEELNSFMRPGHRFHGNEWKFEARGWI